MLLAAFISLAAAQATPGFFLESGFYESREELASLEVATTAAGLSGRAVKRFRLGRGWAWVLIVEGFDSEGGATEAARSLAAASGRALSVVATGGGPRTAVQAEPVEAPVESPRATAVLARAVAAHGGAAGGSVELARATAVHFEFRRELRAGGTTIDATHDYWREGASRRLAVDVSGAGQDSVLVATGSGGWLAAGPEVVSRDIGVLVNQADAFAPEAVLGLALGVPDLLLSDDGAVLLVLEGAERGVRVGRGEDPTEGGLAFADVDPQSGLLLGARYVTEGGPVLFTFDNWIAVTPGVVYPASVRKERPDGQVETISVSKLEVAVTAPAGTFAVPTATP